jgi:hypothetical protein
VKSIFAYFDKEGPVVGNIIKQLGQEVPKVVKAFTAWGGASLGGVSVILTVIGKLSPGQLTLIAGGFLAISAATKLFNIGVALSSTLIPIWEARTKLATIATKAWGLAQLAFNAIMDANPIILILSAIVIGIVLVVKYHKQLAAIAEKIWKDIASWGIAAWHGIETGFKFVFNFIKHNWPLILAILTGPIGLAVLFITKKWHTITSTLGNVLSTAVSWFKALPGRILAAIGNLGSLLWNAGASLIHGLIGGVESQFGKVKSMFGKLTSFIPSWKGPPETDKRLLFGNGQLVMDGFMGGVTSRMPNLRQTLGNVTSAVQRGVTPHVSAAGRGSSGSTVINNITVHAPTGDGGAIGRTIVQTINDYFRQTGQGQLATSKA